MLEMAVQLQRTDASANVHLGSEIRGELSLLALLVPAGLHLI